MSSSPSLTPLFLQETYSYIYNTLKVSPAVIYAACLLAFVATKEKFYLVLLIATIVFGDTMTHIQKRFFKKFLPSHIAERPCVKKTGCNRTSECGVFPRVNKNHISYGFPSGHAQISALAATLLSFYLYRENGKKAYPSIFALFILVLLVALQRMHSNCHTFLQVVFGWLFGVIYGCIVWYTIKWFNMKLQPSWKI